MATVVYCDPGVLGREQRIYKQAILGDESPLEFEDGHAIVEDDEAAQLLIRRVTPIQPGDQSFLNDRENEGSELESVPESEGDEDGQSEDFDAEAFVGRNAGKQVADIESGEYDEHLDAIEAANEAANDYNTVQDAIDERR